jgi:hypothetical protein
MMPNQWLRRSGSLPLRGRRALRPAGELER